MKNQRTLPTKGLTIFLFLLLPFAGNSQLFQRKINQIDNKGRRQGQWITWQDSVRHIPSSKSWFRDGKEYRTTRYYHANGRTRLKLRYHGDSLITISYYDTSGKLTDRGGALRLYTDTEIRYCWDGEWKQYNRHHRVINRQFYRKGEEVILQEDAKIR